jgi:hypothetical protein
MSEKMPEVILDSGGGVLYEIFDGVAESVLGDEYILTDCDTGRQFLCIGNEKAVAMILAEKLRLETSLSSEQPK